MPAGLGVGLHRPPPAQQPDGVLEIVLEVSALTGLAQHASRLRLLPLLAEEASLELQQRGLCTALAEAELHGPVGVRNRLLSQAEGRLGPSQRPEQTALCRGPEADQGQHVGAAGNADFGVRSLDARHHVKCSLAVVLEHRRLQLDLAEEQVILG